MTVETAPEKIEHATAHGTARAAGPRHREEPAPRVLRLPGTTRRRAAVVLAVVVALGGIGTGAAAAAAPKHLGAPKHLRIAPKHLGPSAAAPKHLGPSAAAPKHLALAPKHLSGPSTADPADLTVVAASHGSAAKLWWPWPGVLHGAFTTQTRSGARAWTVQRGEVVSVDVATSTLVVRSADGFVGTWTVDPAARVKKVTKRGPRVLSLAGVLPGYRVAVVGNGAEAAGTATLVQVTGVPHRPSDTPSGTPSGTPSDTPSDPPSGSGGTTV
ncbi:hypothetical protein [Kineosporia sp. R_H_3]|uniref:hypothetical protein n=1 Tax=Kineosporia sp. R_H_3 TaxID=1961848 RepID=UPI000B4B1B7E|nr:hypothetical protein [Kineosporia sp. R_H_3]